jgi:hypothetical protein
MTLLLVKKLGRPHLKEKVHMVVNVYNPSYLGGRGRKITV